MGLYACSIQQELVYTDDDIYGYAKYYNSVRAAVVSLLK
jgi:hypothetical protein